MDETLIVFVIFPFHEHKPFLICMSLQMVDAKKLLKYSKKKNSSITLSRASMADFSAIDFPIYRLKKKHFVVRQTLTTSTGTPLAMIYMFINPISSYKRSNNG